jgi:hypothetical protein
VAVDGPDADLRAGRDVVHLRVEAEFGERLAGGMQHGLAIAPRVSAQRAFDYGIA